MSIDIPKSKLTKENANIDTKQKVEEKRNLSPSPEKPRRNVVVRIEKQYNHPYPKYFENTNFDENSTPENNSRPGFQPRKKFDENPTNPDRRFNDKHSGDPRTGSKPVNKRQGGGRNNWGNEKDYFVDESSTSQKNENLDSKIEESTDDPKYMTLEEYKISQGYVPVKEPLKTPAVAKKGNDVTDQFISNMSTPQKTGYRQRRGNGNRQSYNNNY